MEVAVGVTVFLGVLLLIESVYLLTRRRWSPEVKKVRQRLKVLARTEYADGDVNLVRQKLLSDIPWFNRILLGFRWTHRVNRIIEQAGVRRPIGFFLVLSFLLACGGAFLMMALKPVLILPAAAVLGALPFIYILVKKRTRMRKFERQLPDTLDLISRALKAGHAFTGGLKLAAEELDDPIGTEFEKTLNEINFGVSATDALKSLADRVDCLDLRFFVISVIIQRETGGNLAEILENIARLIRERFKLQGRIRVLAAEGKLSAVILVGIPFVVAFLLSILNPDYIRTLVDDPIGNILIVAALTMMGIGILVMRRMIQIKV